MSNTIQCPKCGSTDADRIRRPALVKLLLFWVSLKRYQCYRCHHRWYIRAAQAKQVT